MGTWYVTTGPIVIRDLKIQTANPGLCSQTAIMAQRARDEGFKGIIGQVLNIPATCHPDLFPEDKYSHTSWAENFHAPILDYPKLMWFWSMLSCGIVPNVLQGLMAKIADQYLPTVTSDVGHSPLLAKSFEGLAPALVQVAGKLMLREPNGKGRKCSKIGNRANTSFRDGYTSR